MSTMQRDPTIYVIDDDEAVRDSLEFLLKSAGITVRGFDSAKAFLEAGGQFRLRHHRRAHARDHRHRPAAQDE
jgi:FixJ family two-component response regulator